MCGGDEALGLSTGEFMSLFTYTMQILMSLMMLSMVFVMIIMARFAGASEFNLYSAVPETHDTYVTGYLVLHIRYLGTVLIHIEIHSYLSHILRGFNITALYLDTGTLLLTVIHLPASHADTCKTDDRNHK